MWIITSAVDSIFIAINYQYEWEQKMYNGCKKKD